MDFEAFLREIQASESYRGQVAHVERQPARAARYAEPAEGLSAACRRMLAGMGIERLYVHQARALDAARAGQDVLVTTATASGKTLCYQLPIIERLEADPEARAICLYPTKALSQDQCRVLDAAREQAGLDDALIGVIDGDTPASQRRQLRDQASVLITNPDMLHAAILPQHPRWAHVFRHLTFIVVDELHSYTGLLGSNVANLFRRIHRLCAHYGSRPQILASSATIANPAEVAERVLGRPVTLIADDGSPRGARTYVLWNPPLERRGGPHRRRSANVEATDLLAALVRAGTPTIVFSKAKITAELIYRYARERLAQLAPALADKLAPYRGGYLAPERREIERQLFSGELLAVSSTNALELGIDVGGLDASIVVGYPGTLASFFQQGGRAGRRDRDALVVLVGLDTAINQYVLRHPEYLFGRPIEEGVVQPDNPYVVLGHLRCAAYEHPLPEREVGTFGPAAGVALDVLHDNEKVYHDRERGTWYHSAPDVPQHEVSLRACDDRNVVVIDSATEQVIGEMPKLDAPIYLHPEAIYLHRGDTWFVEQLDMDRSMARVRQVAVDYYTQPLGGTDVHHVDHRLREKPFGTGRVYFGEVTTSFHTWGYVKVHFYTLDAVSVHELDMPTYLMETTAFWVEPSEATCREVAAAGLDPYAGCRGIGYATRMVLPLFVRCQTLDFSHTVGAVNAPWQTTFVYERYPLGLGFTEKAYERAHELLPAVLDHIRRCDCDDGCPCCVGKPLRQYVTWNVARFEGSIPSKRAALRVLEGLLADGANLETRDTVSLGQDDAEAKLVLERSLRRRLEHHREWLVPHPMHPIEPHIETKHPEPEKTDTLKTSDVARRAFRRVRTEKAVRRGSKQPDASTPSPTVPGVIRRGPKADGPKPIRRAGSPLAADARRLVRRRRETQEPQSASEDRDSTRPASEPDPSSQTAEEQAGQEQKPIRAGDPLAALARKRKRNAEQKRRGFDGSEAGR
ncbi:MAG: DEAD/DEAH box helicase [Planctomycetota bacterium]